MKREEDDLPLAASLDPRIVDGLFLLTCLYVGFFEPWSFGWWWLLVYPVGWLALNLLYKLPLGILATTLRLRSMTAGRWVFYLSLLATPFVGYWFLRGLHSLVF